MCSYVFINFNKIWWVGILNFFKVLCTLLMMGLCWNCWLVILSVMGIVGKFVFIYVRICCTVFFRSYCLMGMIKFVLVANVMILLEFIKLESVLGSWIVFFRVVVLWFVKLICGWKRNINFFWSMVNCNVFLSVIFWCTFWFIFLWKKWNLFLFCFLVRYMVIFVWWSSILLDFLLFGKRLILILGVINIWCLVYI